MDTLPPEILSEIVQCLAGENARLSAYAGISHPWQGAVEQQTFRELKVQKDSFDDLEGVFAGRNVCRARHLVRLDVDFGRQQALQDDEQPTRTNIERVPQNDTEKFSKAVNRLFVILADVTRRANDLPSLALRFWCARWENMEAFDLRLSDSVPSVSQVGTFIFDASAKMSALRRSAVIALLKKMPNVRRANIELWDFEDAGARERRAQRQELGDAICGIKMSELEELNLTISTGMLQDEDRKPDYLLSDDRPIKDPYVQILHHLATFPTLKVLRLTGPLVISPTIFSDLPKFPVLSDFQLDFATETADSRWFFIKDEELFKKLALEKSDSGNGENDDEEEDIEVVEIYDEDSDMDETDSAQDDNAEEGPHHQTPTTANFYRTLPNPTLIPTLLLSAAHFVSTTPSLRRFLLRHKNTRGEEGTVHWNDERMSRHLEVWFLKRGMPRSYNGAVTVPADEKFMGEDRLYWRVGEWRPDAEVLGAWRGAVGRDARVFFLREERWGLRLGVWPVYGGELVDEAVG
ncbi:hypothetical protein CC80DRAFT_530563 [Byssothecium circinans]|uniref:F-box domain-containing protein n=1 Tax=Byssothecium circinans TaxID=147558 RepID=A0A6A5ULJ9_9PLEO|nr:hypothetical protein CC80DRAFT_530563 [Byssothecium circinans]